MSTDNSPLPSASEARNKWEQLTQSNSKNSTSTQTPPKLEPARRAVSATFSSSEPSVENQKPSSFHPVPKPLKHVSTSPSFSQSPAPTSIIAPLPPAKPTALKSKPIVAKKPAHLLASKNPQQQQQQQTLLSPEVIPHSGLDTPSPTVTEVIRSSSPDVVTNIVSVTINPVTNRPIPSRTPSPLLPIVSKLEKFSLASPSQSIDHPELDSGSSSNIQPKFVSSSNRSGSIPPPVARRSTPTIPNVPHTTQPGNNTPPPTTTITCASPTSSNAPPSTTNILYIPPAPPSRPITPVASIPSSNSNSNTPRSSSGSYGNTTSSHIPNAPQYPSSPYYHQQKPHHLHQPPPSSSSSSSSTQAEEYQATPLPDPTNFPPPPRHYTLSHMNESNSQNIKPGQQLQVHKRSTSVANSDPSKLMPPPPLPYHSNTHQPSSSSSPPIPQTHNNTTSQTTAVRLPSFEAHDIKPPRSPMAPPPPPSRKLRSSSSHQSLRGDSVDHTSPLPSPGELTTYTAHPSASSPHLLNLPVTGSAPIVAPVPMPAVQSPLPDPMSFPPPPQRGDYFSQPQQTRRISDSAMYQTLGPHSGSTVGSGSIASLANGSNSSQFTLAPPPRRSTTTSFNDHHSSGTEDYGYDSDDTSPGTPAFIADNESYPDSSQSNRKAPIFGGPIHELASKGKVDAAGFFGTTICISSSSSTFAMDILSGEKIWALNHSETRITAIDFKPQLDATLRGRIIWLGTKEGHLWEVDIYKPGISHKRTNVHMHPIVAIQAVGDNMWTMSEDGKICIWDSYINDVPKVFRMTPYFKAHCITGDHIWIGKNRQVHAYHPSLSSKDTFNITARPICCPPLPPGKTGGDFTCAACIQRYPDLIFFGHDDGVVTAFSRSRLAVADTISVSIHKISSIAGVGTNLWIGTNVGVIYVVDVGVKPWRIVKEWKAHESSVRGIISNESSFFSGSQMSHIPVVSIGSEQGVLIWDGLLKTDWIENDMQHHDSEFCTFDDIRVFYVTWNAGAARTSDLDRTDHDRMFLNNGFNLVCNYEDGPEILAFGFQELVELDNKSVTAKTMFQSKRSKKEKAQKVATSTHISYQYKDWQDRLGREIAAYFSENYNLVHSSNMVGLFTCIFVKAKESSRVRSIKSGKTKTGLGGLHGNKGGIAVRLMMDDSSLCFVNCHLAAGQNHILNRNKDIETILETPILNKSENEKYIGKGIFVNGGDGTMILDHEFCFFSGDMNYRINLHRPTAFAMIQEHDYTRLLDADQLLSQLKKNPGHRLRAFHEHPIKFPPTYKFDVGTDTYDTSEKRRVPAWCDRIFYRGRDNRVEPLEYTSLSVRVSDHKPVMGMYTVKVKTIDPSLRKDVYKYSLERWQIHLHQFIEDLAQYYKSQIYR